MRNVLNFLISVVLLGSAAFAQEKSSNIENIMDDLMSYSEPSAPAAVPVVETPVPEPVAAPVEVEPVADPEPADEVEPASVTEADIDTMVQASRNQFLGGEFSKALTGFAEIIKLAPENRMARMYLRTLLERDHKAAEIEGLAAVDAAWSTETVLRSYALADGAPERMGLQNVTSAVDVDSLFPGLEFSDEASAIYQPVTRTIFVQNTLKNLFILETMLEAMKVLKDSGVSEQVEIESKFVEVSEGTLEELGFQWNFDDPTSASVGGTDLDVRDGAAGLFANALRGSPSGSSPELPFSRFPLSGGAVDSDSNWSTFRLQDNFNTTPSFLELEYTGGTAFELLLSALDQSSGADVLSAPRVVTRSGEEATIRVGERHFFPEVYEGEASQGTILQVNYEDWQETLLGVELSVSPEVDGDEIVLALKPRIAELAGWQEYEMAAANSIYTHRQGVPKVAFDHAPVIARLPVFKIREIDTIVRLSDGSTIGMGGLISEKIEAFEDKVPVLGSLPLVGRLFRNEGERAVKRNLLMFVTARKVGPSGRIDTSRSFE